MSNDPIGTAGKRSVREADDILAALSAWRPTQPFPFQSWVDGVKLYRDARVRTGQTIDQSRRQSITDSANELFASLTAYAEPALTVMRNRWSVFLAGAQESVVVSSSTWSSWWRELVEHREIIDVGVLGSLTQQASDSWVSITSLIEEDGRRKLS